MGITPEQRLKRMSVIGASDVPKILGLSQWGGPKDVWTSKVYPTVDRKASDAAQRGILLEKTILDWAADRLLRDGLRDLSMHSNIYYERPTPTGTPIGANCDAVIWTGDQNYIVEKTQDGQPRRISEVPVAIVEAKSSASSEGWGREMTDEIPYSYIAQVMAQMFASGCPVAYIPALIGEGLSFKMYEVKWDEEFIDTMIEECDRFWWHVENKVPPEGPAPATTHLRDIVRPTDKIVKLESEDYSLVEKWEIARHAKVEAAKAEQSAKAEVLMLLGDAEYGVFDQGTLSYKEDARGRRTLRWNLEGIDYEAERTHAGGDGENGGARRTQ